MARATGLKAARDYKSVGTTFDGIRILKPKTKPVAFTHAEIKAAVRSVMDRAELKPRSRRIGLQPRPNV